MGSPTTYETNPYAYINDEYLTPEQRYNAALKMAMAYAGVDHDDLILAQMIADDAAAESSIRFEERREMPSKTETMAPEHVCWGIGTAAASNEFELQTGDHAIDLPYAA